jgi:hypothetical protein
MDDFLTLLFPNETRTTAEIAAAVEALVVEDRARVASVKAALVVKASAPRCSRCGGTGRLSQFMHRANGVCFARGGSGDA